MLKLEFKIIIKVAELKKIVEFCVKRSSDRLCVRVSVLPNEMMVEPKMMYAKLHYLPISFVRTFATAVLTSLTTFLYLSFSPNVVCHGCTQATAH